MDWQLSGSQTISEPIEARREPCGHHDLEWTSLDSAYCRECGTELCCETSSFLRDLTVIMCAYPERTA